MNNLDSMKCVFLLCVVVCLALFSCLLWHNWSRLNSTVAVENIRLDNVLMNEHCTFSARIDNRTNRDFRIVGVQACCNGRLTNYPRLIPAGKSDSIKGEVAIPNETGRFETHVVVFGEQAGTLRSVAFDVQAVAYEGNISLVGFLDDVP